MIQVAGVPGDFWKARQRAKMRMREGTWRLNAGVHRRLPPHTGGGGPLPFTLTFAYSLAVILAPSPSHSPASHQSITQVVITDAWARTRQRAKALMFLTLLFDRFRASRGGSLYVARAYWTPRRSTRANASASR